MLCTCIHDIRHQQKTIFLGKGVCVCMQLTDKAHLHVIIIYNYIHLHGHHNWQQLRTCSFRSQDIHECSVVAVLKSGHRVMVIVQMAGV